MAFLTGCSEPNATTSLLPSRGVSAGQNERPATGSNGALIYASGGCGGACVLSYPDGSVVSKINISGVVKGTCSDAKGNVFITNDSKALEFAHSGTNPIAGSVKPLAMNGFDRALFTPLWSFLTAVEGDLDWGTTENSND
jgi:hypothetical protein